MTWADFYLICFAVGFFIQPAVVSRRRSALALASAALFAVHAALKYTARQAQRHRGHVAAGGVGWGEGDLQGPAASLSPFNFITLTAFLAWFGGTGYLLTRFSSLWLVYWSGACRFQRRHRRRNCFSLS